MMTSRPVYRGGSPAGPEAPGDATTVLDHLRGGVRRVDEGRMTGAQFASDLVERLAPNMAASGQENDAILGVEILDGGAPDRLRRRPLADCAAAAFR